MNVYSIVLLSMIFVLVGFHVQAQSDFITTWKTNNPGVTDSTSIRIPTKPDLGYSYDVDWNNDGVYDEFGITDSVTHDFGVAGTYTIRIRGDFRWIYFDGEGDKEKLLDVAQWGDLQWKSMVKAFKGCKNLNFSASDAPDLSQVTSMTDMFAGCTAFNSPIDHWDVSNVEVFYFCFSNCINFNQPLNNWNMSSATSVDRMFSGCTIFNQPLDQWDVSNVTNFGATFQNCSQFNQPIGNWDVSSAKIMGALFNGASSFNQDIGNWNVSNVFNMKIIFHKAAAFNQDIGAWDVGNVTNLSSAFKGAQKFNYDIGNWNVSKVTTMAWMFAGAADFNQDIGNWDVSNVTNMNYVFFYAKSFNHDIGNWDVSNVQVMANMFKASPFNQDIGNWDVGKVTSMASMFEASTDFDQNLGNWNVSSLINADRMFNLMTLSTPNYDSLLIGWNKLDLQNDVLFHGGKSIYCEGGPARANMMAANNWVISDSGAERDVPIALCNGLNLFLATDGSLSIDANLLDNGSFDLCTDVLLSASKLTFDCSDVGLIADTLTVMDENGNSSFCISTITIADAPLSFNCPTDITVNVNSSNCRAVVNWAAPEGNCRTTITSSHISGDIFELGTTTVSYTATDNLANATNCSFTVTVQSDLIINTEAENNPTCFNLADGQISIDIQGGAAPYTIDWDNDGVGDNDDLEDLINLGPGNYELQIIDNFGCRASQSFELDEPDALEINVDQLINPNCFNAADGAIAISIAGGTEPYLIDWDNDGVGDNDDLENLNGLEAGIYNIQISDHAGCVTNETITLSEPTALEINTDNQSNPSCFNSTDGALSINIDGGTGPYIFDWDNDGIGDNDDEASISGLGAGAHQIQIIDEAGCITQETFSLQQPTDLELSTTLIESEDNESMQIDLTVDGGTPFYLFDWNMDGMGDEDDAEDIEVFENGIYQVLVEDLNGCTFSLEVEVIFKTTGVSCEENNLNLYPNPNRGNFNLQLDACFENSVIDIFDVLGKKIYSEESSEMENVIKLESLPGGTYFLRVSSREEIMVEPFVISRD